MRGSENCCAICGGKFGLVSHRHWGVAGQGDPARQRVADPEGYLRDVIAWISPITRSITSELLSRNWRPRG
jgi:hypothetical protein